MRDADGAALTGILLAAGRGRRFDPSGVQSKLLQALPDGTPVAVASAKSLLAVLPHVIAVVRADDEKLALQLRACGCSVSLCANADDGMAASLVHGLAQSRLAHGWVMALADMPFVQPATITVLTRAIARGAQISAPVYQGQRGNPVAFSRAYLPDLLSLRGDEGARRLLKTFPVAEVPVDDSGVRRDIDTLADLQTARTLRSI